MVEDAPLNSSVSESDQEISRLTVSRHRLSGEVHLSGAKNSALRLLAASILTSETIELTNYPASLLDSKIHVEMLVALGKDATQRSRSEILLSEPATLKTRLEWQRRSIRNTLLVLGALVARFGEAAVPLPGGCQLGERKFDLHELVLKKLGADVWTEGDYICARAPKGLLASDIYLPLRSTGATENAVIAGTLARGVTRIWDPHVRPEILDLIALLRKMGSKIRVFGQEHIEVEGVEELHGASHRVIPDNMEAITWLVGAGVTGGDVEIHDFPMADLEVALVHLRAAGAQLYQGERSLIVRGETCFPIEISTGPHPGINSDVQPLFAVWGMKARGETRIIDLRFPGRYGYAAEMERMGLKHKIVGDMLVIFGNGGKLTGSTVRAVDLRAGAALALAGLIASGETTVADAWQIERGYVDFAQKLRSLGAYVQLE